MGIVIAIIIFSLTIIFHELGHFILAKITKSVWMNSLWVWDRL